MTLFIQSLVFSFYLHVAAAVVGVVVVAEARGRAAVGVRAVDEVSDRIRSVKDQSGVIRRIGNERIDNNLFRSFDFGAAERTSATTLGILSQKNISSKLACLTLMDN